jgi:DNA-binding transcriptional MerR regulator
MSNDTIRKTNWTIGELAEEFNCTLRTLRFYESRGILNPRRVDRNGKDDLTGRSHAQRLYSIRDRQNLMAVLKARLLGFTLDEAKDLAHDEGQLVLSEDQIATQLVHLRRMKEETDAAIAELSASVELEEAA